MYASVIFRRGHVVSHMSGLRVFAENRIVVGTPRLLHRAQGDALDVGGEQALSDQPIGISGGLPANMRDYVNTSDDNGGVHINSGIPNHAFYLMAVAMGGYAWEKAGKIWYVAARDKWNNNTDFQGACDLTYQTAGELYGVGSAEQQAVKYGWDGVGITVGAAPQPQPQPGSGCLAAPARILRAFLTGQVQSR